MSKYEFSLANPADESQLRELIKTIIMDGALRISYQREPDFFLASQVEGRSVQTIVMREKTTGQIVGMGNRSVKDVYINGHKSSIGYLSSLRGRHEHRKSTGLVKGYRFLKQCHDQDPQTRLYLSTILEDNNYARNILESGRCGLPCYHDIGRFYACAVGLRQKTIFNPSNNYMVRQASPEDAVSIATFLNQEGKQKQFFPCYTLEDLIGDSGLLPGLPPDHIHLAFQNERLVGVTAAWDQKSFRQSFFLGYRSKLKFIKPLVNPIARFLGYPVLPAEGQRLNYLNLALVCVVNNQPDIFEALLCHIHQTYQRHYSFYMAGLHESDPLLSVIFQLKHIPYPSRLYLVCWEDGEDHYQTLDTRIPYLETGAL